MRELEELEAAQADLERCMGGVDPVGAVAAAKRIVEARRALRDDAAMIFHLQAVLDGKSNE